jgi:hypothetical protein
MSAPRRSKGGGTGGTSGLGRRWINMIKRSPDNRLHFYIWKGHEWMGDVLFYTKEEADKFAKDVYGQNSWAELRKS